MTIGERIKFRREELGLSQEDLAHKLGYKNRSSINKIEQDKQNLRQSKIKAIADALEVTPSYIMGWDSESEEQMYIDAYESFEMEYAYNLGISIDAVKIAKQWDSLDEEQQKQIVLMLAFLKDQQSK